MSRENVGYEIQNADAVRDHKGWRLCYNTHNADSLKGIATLDISLFLPLKTERKHCGIYSIVSELALRTIHTPLGFCCLGLQHINVCFYSFLFCPLI